MQPYCEMKLCSRAELDLEKTFECGQCFRWNREGDAYVGVALGRAVRVYYDEGDVVIGCGSGDFELWRRYFDLDTDYSAISFGDVGGYFAACEEFGRGIRILRQDFWEALCSFIISQCNNIPRIKGIVEKLCRDFGEAFIFRGSTYYKFPDAEAVAALDAEDLAPLRAGYRAPYIIAAARAVAAGEPDFAALADRGEAMAALMRLPGVGKKVASCAALYGLHDMTGFPVDTWMRHALRENFPASFSPEIFGEYAGLAQQYIFYYARSGPAQIKQG